MRTVLARTPYVEAFGDAPAEAGGWGATIVTLRVRSAVIALMSIPKRVLGRTGEQVSILCLGGWHIRAVEDDNEAIRIMHTAIGEGLTFFDNAWDYHWGASEELMGRALEGRRHEVFLMTKNCERDYEGSKRCLEESLRRLNTDYVDLWQFHELVYDNDPEWIFERGGLRAALEAKKEGKVRYLGFTGHKHPWIHLDMLSRSDEWDTTLIPVNVMDAHYRSFIKNLIPAAEQKGVAVLGMKGLGGGISGRSTFPDACRPDRGGMLPLRVFAAHSLASHRHSVDGPPEAEPRGRPGLQANVAGRAG